MSARRRLVVIAAALSIVVAASSAALIYLNEPARQLERTADAIEASGGFTVTGSHRTDFAGALAPSNQEIRFRASFAAPDRMTLVSLIPFTDGEHEEYFETILVSEGNAHFLFEDVPGGADGYIPVESPHGFGVDIESAGMLPGFLRGARDVQRDPSADDAAAVTYTAIGDARDYPGAIFYGGVTQTVLDVPLRIWIDPDTDLPVRLDLRPRQWPTPSPGEDLRYLINIHFDAFGPGEQTRPEPLASEPTNDGDVLNPNGSLEPEPSASPDEEPTSAPTDAADASPSPDASPSASQEPAP